MAATASDISSVSMKVYRPSIRVKVPQALTSTQPHALGLRTSMLGACTFEAPGVGPPLGPLDIPVELLTQVIEAIQNPQWVDPLARYQPTRTTSVWEQLRSNELYHLVKHNLSIRSELGTLRNLIHNFSNPVHINPEANFIRQLSVNVYKVGLPGVFSPQALSPFRLQQQQQVGPIPVTFQTDSSPTGVQYLDFSDIDGGLDVSLGPNSSSSLFHTVPLFSSDLESISADDPKTNGNAVPTGNHRPRTPVSTSGNLAPTLGPIPIQLAPRVKTLPPRTTSKPIIPIRLPLIDTILPRIPIGRPPVAANQNALIGAYTPHQEAITNLGQVDPNRVLTSRARRSDRGPPRPGELTPYSMTELKAFARILGLSKSQNKKDLAEAILAKLR